jgi:hypothetical protein
VGIARNTQEKSKRAAIGRPAFTAVYRLQHFVFETHHSAWPAKVNFAYASWADGGAPRLRRLSNFSDTAHYFFFSRIAWPNLTASPRPRGAAQKSHISRK